MNILTILLEVLPVVFDLIDSCQAEESEQRMFYRIRNPGPGAIFRLAKEVRDEQGWTRREWRQRRSETIRNIRLETAALTDDECRMLLTEWREDRQADVRVAENPELAG